MTFVLTITPSIASACRGGENTPPNSFEHAYKDASIAFIGKVVSIESPSKKNVVATFEIQRAWKGPKTGNPHFEIETGRSCDLGKYVEVGSRWFILANKDGEKILTASHSHRLFDTKELENQIKELEKIK